MLLDPGTGEYYKMLEMTHTTTEVSMTINSMLESDCLDLSEQLWFHDHEPYFVGQTYKEQPSSREARIRSSHLLLNLPPRFLLTTQKQYGISSGWVTLYILVWKETVQFPEFMQRLGLIRFVLKENMFKVTIKVWIDWYFVFSTRMSPALQREINLRFQNNLSQVVISSFLFISIDIFLYYWSELRKARATISGL